jgi:hypothetical protein
MELAAEIAKGSLALMAIISCEDQQVCDEIDAIGASAAPAWAAATMSASRP